jgi:hypothetical protein
MVLDTLSELLIEQNTIGRRFTLESLGSIDNLAQCGIASSHGCA